MELAKGFKHLPSHFACGPNTLKVKASGAATEAKIVKSQITQRVEREEADIFSCLVPPFFSPERLCPTVPP